MIRNFVYNNVTFKKYDQDIWLVVKGDITNRSGKSYHAVVFRIVLFINALPICNTVVTINGFHNGQTRTFEKPIQEIEYTKVVDKITKYDIYAESAY